MSIELQYTSMCVSLSGGKPHFAGSHVGGVNEHQVIFFVLVVILVDGSEHKSNAYVILGAHVNSTQHGVHPIKIDRKATIITHTCQRGTRKEYGKRPFTSWTSSSWTSSSSFSCPFSVFPVSKMMEKGRGKRNMLRMSWQFLKTVIGSFCVCARERAHTFLEDFFLLFVFLAFFFLAFFFFLGFFFFYNIHTVDCV